MASTFTTGFGIEKIGSGEQSGAWGTTTNHNLDILDRIASYKAVALSGTTHTLTVREASPGSGTENLQDGMYRVIKFTGALGGNNTVTIAPNTAPAYFIFENATTDSGSSGPYSVILTQGSGANITIQNGKNAIVYCDGAGSGAAVVNALSDLQIATLEVTGAAAIDGALTAAAIAATTVTTSGILSVDDTTTSTSGTTGSIHTDGGLGVAGTAFVAGAAKIVGVTTHGGNVVSDTDSTDDLGTTSVRWKELFVDAITATDQVTATGFTGTLDGILGSGTPAAATVTTLNTTGAATLGSGVDITGSATFAPANGSTDTCSIEVGNGRSGNGYAFLDLIGDATYTDYGLRLIRDASGANTTSSLVHHGTGTLTLDCLEAADIRFKTTNAEIMRIKADGKVGIGTSSPGALLTVTGITANTGDGVVRFIHPGNQSYGTILTLETNAGTDPPALGFKTYNGGSPAYYSIAQSSSGALTFNSGAGISGFGTERMRLDSSGNLMVGTTDSTPYNNSADSSADNGICLDGAQGLIAIARYQVDPLALNRTGNDGTIVSLNRSGVVKGTISITTSAVAYNTTSDYRLKENVNYDWDATSRLKQLKPARFNFISDADKTVDGFLAHEAQEVVPECVTGVKDEVDADGNPVMQGIDQAKLVPLLTAALQEAVAKIEALETRITALEG